jgi:hypothetical protein
MPRTDEDKPKQQTATPPQVKSLAAAFHSWSSMPKDFFSDDRIDPAPQEREEL